MSKPVSELALKYANEARLLVDCQGGPNGDYEHDRWCEEELETLAYLIDAACAGARAEENEAAAVLVETAITNHQTWYVMDVRDELARAIRARRKG